MNKKFFVILFFIGLVACSSTNPTVQATLMEPTITTKPTPTLIPNEDYDGDSLYNIDEIEKYHTNPYLADSDSDGLPDGDWEERREYSYTVRVLVKIKPPFDLNAMNDPFQDTRLMAEIDKQGYTSLEIIIYPKTRIRLEPSSYPLTNLPPEYEKYTEPGYSTNFSNEMKNEVINTIVKSANSDMQAVQKILNWFDNKTNIADFPFQPEIFYHAYMVNGNVKLRNPPSLPTQKMLENLFYADSMFKNKVHGTCCSTATLKCAVIKSSGIPCKIIQTLFPLFSHMDQKEEYSNNLKFKTWQSQFENQPSGKPSWSANHCFLEVYLGNRWVRVDNSINIYANPGVLSFKILSVPDLTDVDFSKTYPVDWINNRPYYTLLVEDQNPINK